MWSHLQARWMRPNIFHWTLSCSCFMFGSKAESDYPFSPRQTLPTPLESGKRLLTNLTFQSHSMKRIHFTVFTSAQCYSWFLLCLPLSPQTWAVFLTSVLYNCRLWDVVSPIESLGTIHVRHCNNCLCPTINHSRPSKGDHKLLILLNRLKLILIV